MRRAFLPSRCANIRNRSPFKPVADVTRMLEGYASVRNEFFWYQGAFVTPAKAGVQGGRDPGVRRGLPRAWIPAFAGMTMRDGTH